MKKNINPFNLFFLEKGYIGSIAQKAENNFSTNCKALNGSQISDKENKATSRIYYFAVGHALKNIDTKAIFAYKYDDDKKNLRATQYVHIQRNVFDQGLRDFIGEKVHAIRNMCSHYVHRFNDIKLEDEDSKKANIIQNQFIPFLKEAFKLAVVQAYPGESDMTIDKVDDAKIIRFLYDNFIFKDEEDFEEKKQFFKLSSDKALEKVLFIDLDEDQSICIGPGYEVFTATKGRYLSFYASLFLLSMFLYRNEAEILISRIKGFKDKRDIGNIAKRSVFTFFSKKVSSRDVDNEEMPLVKFRDIMQYLNHYPTAWNDQLSDYSSSESSKNLCNKIVEMDIKRLFHEMFETENEESLRFLTYVKLTQYEALYPKKYVRAEFLKADFTSRETEHFDIIIKESKELKGCRKKLQDLLHADSLGNEKEKEIAECTEKIQELEGAETNPDLDAVRKQIDDHLFITSYGRNQDRFMDFAARFLAEVEYFGKDAFFKVYRFETIEEQSKYLEKVKNKLPKEQYDKLKMHRGRLATYMNHNQIINYYSSFDIPFVIENNSIQVFMPSSEIIEDMDDQMLKKIFKGKGTFYVIQRPLIIYLLEQFLYEPSGRKKMTFKALIGNYCGRRNNCLEKYETLLLNDSDSKALELQGQRSEMGKLLPKRLLHHYLSDSPRESMPLGLTELLEDAKQQEARYDRMFDEAERYGHSGDLLKKNKGKQFKLRFVRKAWNLMYFTDIYWVQRMECGDKHHKQFNITRDEFNHFSQWMYAFDEVPEYKECLNRLFLSKRFFEVKEFATLFESGKSLEDFYSKTKGLYKRWLDNKEYLNSNNKPKIEKNTWNNYKKILDGSTVCINLSLFIKILEDKNLLEKDADNHIIYKVQENMQYLISDYYMDLSFDRVYKDRLGDDESHAYKKLYNKLRTNRLEDALLYEMALYYMSRVNIGVKEARTHVCDLFNKEIDFSVYKNDDKENYLYKVQIPFYKIDAFDRLAVMNKSFDKFPPFTNQLYDYLTEDKYQSVFLSSERNAIRKRFIETKILTFDDFCKLLSSLRDDSLHFSNVHMFIEKYTIIAGGREIKDGEDMIEFDAATLFDLQDDREMYAKVRNAAMHFNVPEIPYRQFLMKMQEGFIQKWVMPLTPTAWESLNKGMQEVCYKFMNVIYNRKKGDESWYFNNVIKELIYVYDLKSEKNDTI